MISAHDSAWHRPKERFSPTRETVSVVRAIRRPQTEHTPPRALVASQVMRSQCLTLARNSFCCVMRTVCFPNSPCSAFPNQPRNVEADPRRGRPETRSEKGKMSGRRQPASDGPFSPEVLTLSPYPWPGRYGPGDPAPRSLCCSYDHYLGPGEEGDHAHGGERP